MSQHPNHSDDEEDEEEDARELKLGKGASSTACRRLSTAATIHRLTMVPLSWSLQQLSLGCAAAFAVADTLDNTSVAIILKTYMETKQRAVSPAVTCYDCHACLVSAHQSGGSRVCDAVDRLPSRTPTSS